MIPNVVPLFVGAAVLVLIGQDLDIGTVLVTSICLGIAVDDTVHFFDSYEKHRADCKSAHEAVALTLDHTGPALVMTTLVLIAAFGTLGFATFVPNVYFGVMTAIILFVALVTELTLSPTMLLLGITEKEKK